MHNGAIVRLTHPESIRFVDWSSGLDWSIGCDNFDSKLSYIAHDSKCDSVGLECSTCSGFFYATLASAVMGSSETRWRCLSCCGTLAVGFLGRKRRIFLSGGELGVRSPLLPFVRAVCEISRQAAAMVVAASNHLERLADWKEHDWL